METDKDQEVIVSEYWKWIEERNWRNRKEQE